jgi:valyl-tRNA synthetase
MQEIAKAYESDKVEQRLYSFWMDKGYFKPVIDRNKKPFTIIMPPPNVTGELHLGHALTATFEDILIRWHRMKGDPTLWLPGVDHAGIATQVVVEQNLLKEGLDRHKLGREKFLEHVWKWVNTARRNITLQHQRLGASCDWSREKFTLDEGPALAVRTAFYNLYKKGLIYRGERLITWCPRCRTALSDLEVQHKDMTGHLYYIHYKIAGDEEHITVATTRPETYLGDTAVAVNPDDKRYQKLIGKKVILPIINREIPVIADSAVDPSFGTGLVKITPAHDPVDFEVAQRQNLPMINIMNPDATLNENAGPFAGMERFAARKKVMEELEKQGLVEKVEPLSHAVGHCDRCQTMTEPWVSLQWFVKIEPLAKPAIEAVTSGKVKIIPERFNKVYLNWMENIRDWCISRQLWWGHQIPVWYCRKCDETIVSIETPAKCSKCNSTELVQETDVLDTWFSSALWPHSTLGWPEKTEDLGYFYPTGVMVTGYDILFFWVARMIMMGLEDMDDIPFEFVYLNGLIRDEKGHKMSKVRRNVINPLEVIDKYGTDALRFAVTTGTAAGNDVNIGEHKLEAARNFANKIWNASRFVLQNLEKSPVTAREMENISPDKLSNIEDRWILSRLNRLIQKVDDLMADFQFGEAEKELYEFLWGEYCDWYIEIAKSRLNQAQDSPLPVLISVLDKTLRLLHPFMPFITDEIWQNIKQRVPGFCEQTGSIMIAAYPEADTGYFNDEAERIMDSVIDITRAIRNIRAEYKVELGKWIEARVYLDELKPAIAAKSEIIQTLAKVRPLHILNRKERKKDEDKVIAVVLKEAEVVLPLAGMVDTAAEKKRLSEEMSVLHREIERLGSRLQDNSFLSKAPEAVVNKEKDRLQSYKDKVNRLEKELSLLG